MLIKKTVTVECANEAQFADELYKLYVEVHGEPPPPSSFKRGDVVRFTADRARPLADRSGIGVISDGPDCDGDFHVFTVNEGGEQTTIYAASENLTLWTAK